MTTREKVAVVGLGKLGVPIAACLAAKGFDVAGVDLDSGRVDAVNEGRAPFYEPDLQELIEQSEGRLRATKDTRDAVRDADATFIVVPTPSEPHGGFSLRFALAACEEIGAALGPSGDYHLVVVTSTVMPGATDGPIRETLERASGGRCGERFGLCYSPEFIALGSVIRDFLNPDFLLVGESDARAGDALEAIYRGIHQSLPEIARMSSVNAELAKLSVNSFVTARIAFANTIARICERLPGGDADVVTEAIGLDSRIGRKYLKGALPFGGPCFPRDNAALASLAHRIGAPATIPEATARANDADLLRLLSRVGALTPDEGSVGVLGLSYKPFTEVVEASAGLRLAEALACDGYPVVAYDPAAMDAAREATRAPIEFASSAVDCVGRSDVVVVATPWPEFGQLGPSHWSARPTRMLIDCWRMFRPERLGPDTDWVPLGVGPAR